MRWVLGRLPLGKCRLHASFAKTSGATFEGLKAICIQDLMMKGWCKSEKPCKFYVNAGRSLLVMIDLSSGVKQKDTVRGGPMESTQISGSRWREPAVNWGRIFPGLQCVRNIRPNVYAYLNYVPPGLGGDFLVHLRTNRGQVPAGTLRD